MFYLAHNVSSSRRAEVAIAANSMQRHAHVSDHIQLSIDLKYT